MNEIRDSWASKIHRLEQNITDYPNNYRLPQQRSLKLGLPRQSNWCWSPVEEWQWMKKVHSLASDLVYRWAVLVYSASSCCYLEALNNDVLNEVCMVQFLHHTLHSSFTILMFKYRSRHMQQRLPNGAFSKADPNLQGDFINLAFLSSFWPKHLPKASS